MLAFAVFTMIVSIPVLRKINNFGLRNVTKIGINLIRYYCPFIKTIGSYKLIKLNNFYDSGISFREIKFITGSERGKSILLEQSIKTIDTEETGDIIVNGKNIYYDKSLPPSVLHKLPLRNVKTNQRIFENVKDINSTIDYVVLKVFEE